MTGKLTKEEAAELRAAMRAIEGAVGRKATAIGYSEMRAADRDYLTACAAFERRLAELTEG